MDFTPENLLHAYVSLAVSLQKLTQNLLARLQGGIQKRVVTCDPRLHVTPYSVMVDHDGEWAPISTAMNSI